jgi:hypothetical protein
VIRLVRSWRLRTALLIIAVLALVLGLGVHLMRRHDRIWRLGLAHGIEGERIERSILTNPGLTDEESNTRFRLVHWHGYVAEHYWQTARRPWRSYEPDPSHPYCACRICRIKPWVPAEQLRVSTDAEKLARQRTAF